jgi:hypothetical protein
MSFPVKISIGCFLCTTRPFSGVDDVEGKAESVSTPQNLHIYYSMKRLFFVLLTAASSSLVAQDIDLTGYTLTFEDNFDVLSVDSSAPTKDSSKWYYWPPYGGSGNYGHAEWSVANTQTIQNGVLNITAWFDPSINYWRSGNISSKDEKSIGFSQRFGYFSARSNAKRGNRSFAFGCSAIMQLQTGIPATAGDRHLEWFEESANSLRSYASTVSWNDGGSQGAKA